MIQRPRIRVIEWHEHNEPLWWLTKDGDKDCLAMYERHYSAYHYVDGRKRAQFVGPGEKVVLRTKHADALWVWRKFIDDSGQTGINCAVFRNESGHQSSRLIRQADQIADCLWPDSRHYTYVNPQRIASRNPGYCFAKAGWRKCGWTRGGAPNHGTHGGRQSIMTAFAQSYLGHFRHAAHWRLMRRFHAEFPWLQSALFRRRYDHRLAHRHMSFPINSRST